VGIGSAVLIGRAAYIQIVGTDFYLKQGEMRYAHTLEVPASRGRIVDRNGLLLATSVPTPVRLGDPEGRRCRSGRAQGARARAGHERAGAEHAARRQPNFVWLKRQVDDSVGAAVKQLGLKGVHQAREYRRRYPEGEAAGARGRLHRRRGQGPGRHRARLPAKAAGSRRHARGRQGPAWAMSSRTSATRSAP
jgi:cell division protein FtsI (penicillin-binding protein 3)